LEFVTFDLSFPMGQVVDTLSAQEFMREAMAKISVDDLDGIARDVAAKSDKFRAVFAADKLMVASQAELRSALKQIFAVRRRVDQIYKGRDDDSLRILIRDLLYGDAPIPSRFQDFTQAFGELEENMRYDLASELLHFSRPDEYWLWTRWMWDPETETGSLRLVTMDEVDLRGETLGETYMKVGEAIAFTNATGEAAGFTRIGDGKFGLDVFLACVYGVYTYTVLRMRMTQEFNKVVPQLPELARRLLGVWAGRVPTAVNGE
jgi:hypothetical protein